MKTSFKYIALMVMFLALLVGCGKEGPFGNTPGPKKPQYLTDWAVR